MGSCPLNEWSHGNSSSTYRAWRLLLAVHAPLQSTWVWLRTSGKILVTVSSDVELDGTALIGRNHVRPSCAPSITDASSNTFSSIRLVAAKHWPCTLSQANPQTSWSFSASSRIFPNSHIDAFTDSPGLCSHLWKWKHWATLTLGLKYPSSSVFSSCKTWSMAALGCTGCGLFDMCLHHQQQGGAFLGLLCIPWCKHAVQMLNVALKSMWLSRDEFLKPNTHHLSMCVF